MPARFVFGPLLVLTICALACPAAPKPAPPPAGGGAVPQATADPIEEIAEVAQDAEPVPPGFDPATADAANTSMDFESGPLKLGVRSGDGMLSVFTLADGEQREAGVDIPCHLELEAVSTARGIEFRAQIRTRETKEEGGFLFLTASTGGNGEASPPVKREAVFARKDGADGLWHYGAQSADTALGLINLKDLNSKIENSPSTTVDGDSLAMQFFEGVLDDPGAMKINGQGRLSDGRILILLAEAAETTMVEAPAAETPPATVSGGGSE